MNERERKALLRRFIEALDAHQVTCMSDSTFLELGISRQRVNANPNQEKTER